jgi:MFS family permease
MHTLVQLYLYYSVIVGLAGGSGNVALLSTTARWFIKRRSMMSGIVKVGTGAGIFIMPLVASWLILNYGWRNSYLVMAIVLFLVIVSAAQFLRRDPRQKGLEPYGSDDEVAVNVLDKGYSLHEAMHTRQFWMVSAMYFVSWYCAMTTQVHIAQSAVDTGISAANAASILATIGGVSIIGRLVMGGTGDKVGNRRALVICFFILVASLSWLQLAKGLWALYLFSAIYGFSHGGFFALVSPLIAELFGTKAHGSIFGVVLFVSQVGGAIGPVATGRLFDITGSYQSAFIVLLFIGIMGLILSMLLKPLKPGELK